MISEQPRAQDHCHLPADCTSINFNFQYCHCCGSPLALLEILRCPNEAMLVEACRQMKAEFSEEVQNALEIPAFKLSYTGTPFQLGVLMQVGRPEAVILSHDNLVRFIDDLHNCEICRALRQGRFKGR